jgi:hypothetical protein
MDNNDDTTTACIQKPPRIVEESRAHAVVVLETIYVQFFVLKSIEVKRMNLRESHDVLSFKKAPPLVKNFIGSLSSAILELSCVAYRSKSCKKKHFETPPERYTAPKNTSLPCFAYKFRVASGLSPVSDL